LKKTKPRAPELRPPAYLSADAARIWRAVVAYLSRNGRLESVDAGTIETYALAVVRQRQLQAEINRRGIMIGDQPHPALRTIEATAATVRSAAHCLGLTPAARKALPARVKQPRLNSGKGADPWAGVLGD
jgi:P27 family predicted phage terminase small subunit